MTLEVMRFQAELENKNFEPSPVEYVFVFPGQGSQFAGMGKDLSVSPAAQSVFEDLDRVMGQGFSAKVFTDETGWLNETENTQPALVGASIAFLEAYLEAKDKRRDIIPLAYLSHSAGYMSALIASGSLDRVPGFILARERGRLMQQAGEKNPGKMGVINGLSGGDIEQVVKEVNNETTQGGVVIANYNSPLQYVLSGFADNVDIAMQRAKERGAIKVDVLPISIASHSPLMAKAAEEFKEAVFAIPFTEPRSPVALNSTGKLTRSTDEIRDELWRGPMEPVRWTNSVQNILSIDPEVMFLEFGPGQVLSKLINRINRAANTSAMNSYQNVQAH